MKEFFLKKFYLGQIIINIRFIIIFFCIVNGQKDEIYIKYVYTLKFLKLFLYLFFKFKKEKFYVFSLEKRVYLFNSIYIRLNVFKRVYI